MILGITGKYCSGKSVLASVFISSGVTLIDVDMIGHEALDLKCDEICTAFGKEILIDSEKNQKRYINRKVLGNIIFRDKKKRALLEEIVHPWMREKVITMLNTTHTDSSQHYVISAALLHKIKLDVLCDVIVLVETNVILRAWRAYKRDRLSFFNIIRRFSAQTYIPTRKVLETSNKTAEIKIIRGVHSVDECKKRLQKYVKCVSNS